MLHTLARQSNSIEFYSVSSSDFLDLRNFSTDFQDFLNYGFLKSHGHTVCLKGRGLYEETQRIDYQISLDLP